MKAGELARDIVIHTPSGSQVAIDVIPGRGTHILVLGGWAARPVVDTPIGRILTRFVRGRNMACTFVDLPGVSRSRLREPPTVDLWLEDISHVCQERGIAGSVWVGASLGAWPMLLLNQRQPGWFRAMCALAPAIDWDATYLLPEIAAGRITETRDSMSFEGLGLLPVPRTLLESMSRHRMSESEWRISAPLHIIHGLADDVASPVISENLARNLRGAPCTLERLAGQSHGVGKLSDRASQASFAAWLGVTFPNPAGNLEAVSQ